MSDDAADKGAANSPIKCGLVMPISAIDGLLAGHWEDVRSIINEALSDTGYDVAMVSDSATVGVIQKRIIHSLYDSDIVICDVSARNPNVMFELGMRLAFDKPVVVIKDDKTDYIFDVSPLEHLDYPRDLRYMAIQTFKTKLRQKVVSAVQASKNKDRTSYLGSFGNFEVPALQEVVVAKDDYVLKALSELSAQVSALTNQSRLSSMPSFDFGDITRPDFGRDQNSAMAFVRNLVSEQESPESVDMLLERLSDTNSLEFKSYFRRYLGQRSSFPKSTANSDFLKMEFERAIKHARLIGP